MNADGWHRVWEYLPHLQAIRLAEKRMSLTEIITPPQMSEKSVDATVLTFDTGVQAFVEMRECSVQFSPTMVDQAISAIPRVDEASIDARPTFSDAGVSVIPVLLDNSVGVTMVGRAVGSLTNVASKSFGAIIETVAPKEIPPNQTESAPKVSFPVRVIRAYVYLVTFPIRLLLCSAKPVEDQNMPTEEIPLSNTTSEKSPVTPSTTAQPAGDKTTNNVETSEKAVGDEPEPTVHLSRAVPVAAF
jgi:hypothetical protein